ncbi:hypothetical protein SAMN05216436_1419 [bacterium A37T11]|nr:hypothetical protein SAMN05216436_1419 [bacterium A37T11]
MDRSEKMLSLVSQWRESRQSQKEFCLSHGITLGKFNYWAAKSKEGLQREGSIPVINGYYSSNGATIDCVPTGLLV